MSLDAAAVALDHARRRHRRGLVALGALTAAASVLSMSRGALAVAPAQVVAVLADRLGVAVGVAFEARHAEVVLALRAPRVALALCVGAALGAAGAALQGLFRNPLADPALLGISSGAAVGASVSIVFGAAAVGLGVPASAFAGAVLASFALHALGGRDGASLLLAGIAVNALCGAFTGAMTFVADDAQLRNLTFWSLGSLGGASRGVVTTLLGPCALGVAVLLRHAGALDALSLGERAAVTLGYDVSRVRREVVLAASLVIGASVAFTGVIGFVGLVAPHAVRLALGASHRAALPGAALLGALCLVGADLVARTAVAPAELPVGIVSAGVGAPVFALLLLRRRAAT